MIPTYCPDPAYLIETLRSVLAQDPGQAQMQIEIIDDGSAQYDFLQAVKDLCGERVSISIEPQNLGLAGIWNRCIERAQGEWIHILHQDDLVYPGFYDAFRAGAQQHPEAGAAFCRHAYCDEKGHWSKLSTLEMSEPGLLPRFVGPLVTGYHIQCAAIAVKRETYKSVGGFDSRLKHALDWEMWIRIANSFSFFYEPRVLAAWRNHGAATTSGQMRSGENIQDIRRAIELWSKHLPRDEAETYAEMARKRVAKEALFGAQMFAEQNDLKACRLQLKEALRSRCSIKVIAAALEIWLKAILRRSGAPSPLLKHEGGNSGVPSKLAEKIVSR